MKRLIRGLNPIAFVTEGLNRFTAFSTPQVFEAETVFREAAPEHLRSLARAGLRERPADRQTRGRAYLTLNHRNSIVSLGHCTALTFFAIAQVSVRRYRGM
jgi:hypothetical protein